MQPQFAATPISNEEHPTICSRHSNSQQGRSGSQSPGNWALHVTRGTEAKPTPQTKAEMSDCESCEEDCLVRCKVCENLQWRHSKCEACFRLLRKRVYYCSKTCQKRDWSRHRSECAAIAAQPTGQMMSLTSHCQLAGQVVCPMLERD